MNRPLVLVQGQGQLLVPLLQKAGGVRMVKVKTTLEGFVRKLEREGRSKDASELRSIIAMSRRRREAVTALSAMTPPLLLHIVKYISMPQARERNKWRREIKSYLSVFDIRNVDPKGKPWLSVDYIQKDIKDVLASRTFLNYVKAELEGYPVKDKSRALGLVIAKSLNIVLGFDSNSDLTIRVNGQAL